MYDNRWRFYIYIFARNKNIHFHQARTGTDNPHTALDLTLIFLLINRTAKTPQRQSNLHDLNQDNIEQSVHWCDPTGETAGFMVKIQSHEVSTPNYDQHILSITCERNEMKCWTRCNTFCSSSAPTECVLSHDQLASVVRIKLILLAMTHHTTLHKHSSQCSRSQSLYTCYVQTLANVTYILCVPVLLRSNVGHGFLILTVPRSHTTTHRNR